MKSRIFILALVLPLALGVLFAACGGDDDDDGGSSDSGSSSNVKTGSDEQYVGDMCKAWTTFATAMDKAMANLGTSSAGDMEKLLKSLVEPMDQFAKDFAKMKPPSDLKEWHATTAKTLAAQVKALKDGKDMSALEGAGDSPVGDMPAGAEERLAKIAAKNKDCAAAEGLFGE